MITVGLLWHSLSSGNLGVGALTESNIAIIRDAAEGIEQKVRFVIMGTGTKSVHSLAQELENRGHAIEIQPARVLRSSFREQIRRCDLVVDIGEGDSFADLYGFKRFFYYWLSKNIVCSLGKPLILAPQTIGPFNGWMARQLARQVMFRCNEIFTRDGLSSKYLQSLGFKKNCFEAIDVAFRLPFEAKPFEPNGKLRVGLNVSGLLFNGGYTGANQFGLSIDYPATVRRLIETFLVQSGVELHLVPHVIVPESPIEDDLATAIELSKEYPSVIVAPRFVRPSDAKGYIANMNFFIGARMHACIAAYSAGVAVLPMAYSRKFNGLFVTLGYHEIADCTKVSSNEVVKMAKLAFDNRESLRTQIALSEEIIASRSNLYHSAISRILLRYV